jgi:hypothetical protein
MTKIMEGTTMTMGNPEALFREYRKASQVCDEAVKTHGAFSEEFSRASTELKTISAQMPAPLINRLRWGK